MGSDTGNMVGGYGGAVAASPRYTEGQLRGASERGDIPLPNNVLNRMGTIHQRMSGHLNDLTVIAERAEKFAETLIGLAPTPGDGGGNRHLPAAKLPALEETSSLQDATERQLQRIRAALGRLGA